MLPEKILQSPETFQFHKAFNETTNNGLILNNKYLPEEIVVHILSFVPPNELLNISTVCKKWCDIIKSGTFWSGLYFRKYNKKLKQNLPWYTYFTLFTTPYFNENLIKNGNGEEGSDHWEILNGDQFKVEDPPFGVEPLPENLPEFNGQTSCFVTSHSCCIKRQEISFVNNKLMQFILNKHKPRIYVSEWIVACNDCQHIYHLWCSLYEYSRAPKEERKVTFVIESAADLEDASGYASEEEESEMPLFYKWKCVTAEEGKWSKVEKLLSDYPNGVKRIVFKHSSFGTKMAGSLVRILFDTLREAST